MKAALRLQPFKHNLWQQFDILASKTNSLNFGIGNPATTCPTFVTQSLTQAAQSGQNKYTNLQGTLPLLQQLSRVYQKKYKRKINPSQQIIVTLGATQAIELFYQTFLQIGDEVIIIEPCFDYYIPPVSIYGGIPVCVQLQHLNSKWILDLNKLESVFTDKTKILVLNTPHNPTGKIFSRKQLQGIVQILQKWPKVCVLSDQVYEGLVFDQNQQVSISNLKGMWERTLTVNSGGKMFAVPGWKIGWGIGGKEIVQAICLAKQWGSFFTTSVIQGAIQRSLVRAEQPYNGFSSYWEYYKNQFVFKKEMMLQIFQKSQSVRIEMENPQGGYFVCGKVREENIPKEYREKYLPDRAFVYWLAEQYGITGIPLSVFYFSGNSTSSQHVRFTLSKGVSEYEKAYKILVGD